MLPTLPRSHLPVTALADFLSFVDLVSDDLAPPLTLICILKQGWRHQQEGKDLGAAVLEALTRYQSTSGKAALIIGSYDPEELQQLALTAGSDPADPTGFMQLIGANDGKEVQRFEFGIYRPYSYDLLFTKFGLKAVSGYAASIGLDPEAVFDETGELLHPRFFDDAHTLGLRVVCRMVDTLPAERFNLGSGPEALFEHLLFTIGFDGIVTSEVRRARSWLEHRSLADESEQDRIIERLIDNIGESDGLPSDPVQSDTTR
jgi:glycerophosphoryl diester phosphodiesterase